MAGRTILLLTKDLFFVPTLRAAADKLDCPLVVALSIDSAKLADLAADEVVAWVIDLNCVPVDSIPVVVSAENTLSTSHYDCLWSTCADAAFGRG